MRDTLFQLVSVLAALAFSTSYATIDAAQDFVNRAAVSAQFEIAVAELAKQLGDDSSRSFAARVRREHEQSQRELARIAGAQKLVLPQQLDPRHAAALESLRSLRGSDFDRAF